MNQPASMYRVVLFITCLWVHAYSHAAVDPNNIHLQHYWNFDDTTSANIKDAVSRTVGVRNTNVVATSEGWAGSALEFVEGKGIITIDNLQLDYEEFSLSVWVKVIGASDELDADSNRPNSRIISKATGLESQQHLLMLGLGSNNTAVRFRLKTESQSTSTITSSAGSFTSDRWVHVVVTYDGQIMSLYLDGKLEASTKKTGKLLSKLGVPVSIGNHPVSGQDSSLGFTGMIDELAIYDTALSLYDISTLGKSNDQEIKAAQNASSSTNDDISALFDSSLPMGGMFYGNYESGLKTGNAPIAYESSRRFRAERTGYIDTIRHFNRVLTDETIKGRCELSKLDSIWCVCVNNRLDGRTCGYALSNSYSVGNGGSIVVEVREDDNGMPHSEALSKTVSEFIPQDHRNKVNIEFELDKPVYLKAGSVYHLVYTNLNPPSSCELRFVSPEAASQCPKDQGAIGLNGVWFAKFGDKDINFDPFRGASAGNLVRFAKDGDWIMDEDNLSWYEVRYADGVWVGDTYAAYGSTDSGEKQVGGENVARQKFQVSDANRVVDGVWVNIGHDYSKLPDGSPMKLLLKDSRGGVLATGQIRASLNCINQTRSIEQYDRRNYHCRQWVYSELSRDIDLRVGQVYSLEMRADTGGEYALSSYFPLDYGPYGSKSRNHWKDARAEFSSDSGQSWSKWSEKYHGRDLAVLFTLKGYPKSLP